jgi:hypothetical protein
MGSGCEQEATYKQNVFPPHLLSQFSVHFEKIGESDVERLVPSFDKDSTFKTPKGRKFYMSLDSSPGTSFVFISSALPWDGFEMSPEEMYEKVTVDFTFYTDSLSDEEQEKTRALVSKIIDHLEIAK